jgi:predicted RNA-binding Zn-ribbon protein involved in translation (DUF1610 family)
MSIPSLTTVLRSLREDGEIDLANSIQRRAEDYRCETCGFRSNPGVTITPPDGVDFYCPWCSGERVRPDDPQTPS